MFFDVRVLDNRFDHPVGLADAFKIFVEASDLDLLNLLRHKQPGRRAFLESVESGFGLFDCDVQQQNQQPRIRGVSGNLRSHRARTKHCDISDHGCP